MKTAMGKQVAPFQLVGGHPVLDFVNTLDWRFRPSGDEELLTEYADLLRFVRQAGLTVAAQTKRLAKISQSRAAEALERARQLREALAGVFYNKLDQDIGLKDSIRRLAPFLEASRKALELTEGKAYVAWSWSPKRLTAADFPVWLLAQSAEQLLLSDAALAIRACCNEECRWLFLDISKNHSRRWCDMKLCGNRMKARRFKAAQKSD